ncbi:hypothetical protein K470DRAFT_297152, partial [Piedraia hortae CBS 480.64]
MDARAKPWKDKVTHWKDKANGWVEKVISKLSISPTPRPSSPHSATTQAAGLGKTPQTSFKDQDKLLDDALKYLSTRDQVYIDKQLFLKNDPARDEARLLALKEQYQKRSGSYRDRMGKIAGQIMNFVPVFDVATNVQPEVLSLPWAGIRFLLMVTQKAHEQNEALLEGIEITLDTSI